MLRLTYNTNYYLFVYQWMEKKKRLMYKASPSQSHLLDCHDKGNDVEIK